MKGETEGVTAEEIEYVHAYLTDYGRLGAHPYQIAKALRLNERVVKLALESLQKEGKIRIRSSNIEWKIRHAALASSVKRTVGTGIVMPERGEASDSQRTTGTPEGEG